MRLTDLIDSLNFGELSQLRFGQETEEGITAGNIHRLVPHINMGLSALHSRFRLRVGQRRVALEYGRESYPLTSAEGQGRVLQVERVLWPEGLDSAPGFRVTPDLPLDDEGHPLSIYRATPTTLRVPLVMQDMGVTQLEVTVREDHPALVWEEGFFYPEEIEIDLPPNYLEPLTYFVASRLINPIGVGMPNTEFHEGNNYAAKYEQACQRLEYGGYKVQGEAEDTRFQRHGWV